MRTVVQRLVSALAVRYQELAEEVSVTYSTLSAWSAGRRRPSRENALRLAEMADRRAAALKALAAELRRTIKWGTDAAENDGRGATLDRHATRGAHVE